MTMDDTELERQNRLRRQGAQMAELADDPAYTTGLNARARSEMRYSNSPNFTPLDIVAGGVMVVMLLGPLLAGGAGWGG
jgi:hypothetical protein